jgi:hypothetical protein
MDLEETEAKITVLAKANSNLTDQPTGYQSRVLRCTVRYRYPTTTSEQTEHFMWAVVVVIYYRVWKSVRLLQLFEITSYKRSTNPIINPDLVSGQ